jgi:hypothetical protein
METGLRESQIIQRNAPAPNEIITGPRWVQQDPQKAQMMRTIMGDTMFKLFMYNKNCDDRICPGCMTKYNVLPPEEGKARIHDEQKLSGICSLECWLRLNGPDGYDPEEWLGTEAKRSTAIVVGDEVYIQLEKKDGQ